MLEFWSGGGGGYNKFKLKKGGDLNHMGRGMVILVEKYIIYNTYIFYCVDKLVSIFFNN